MITSLILSPSQDGARLAAVSPNAAHLGRSSRRRRPQAHAGTPSERPAPLAADPRPGTPGACHASQRAARPLPSIRPGLPRRAPRARRGLPRAVSDSSVHGPGRPSPSHRRGRRRAGTRPRAQGPGHPRRAGGQPRAQPPRRRLDGQVSRPGAHQPAGRAKRACVRAHESPEASRGRARPGPLLVGAVVHRVAVTRSAPTRGNAGGPRTHLACRRRLAPARPPRARRTAEWCARPGQAVVVVAGGLRAPGQPDSSRSPRTRSHP